MIIKSTAQKAHRYAKKTYIDIRIEVELDKWDDFNSLKKRLNINLPWMADHICQWGDYDHAYSIQLFVDSLQALGRGLLRWNNVVGSLRNGRRALTAAGMLKRAYEYESWEDASYKNWSARNRHIHVPIKIKGQRFYEMQTLHDYSNAMNMDREKYADKMWKIIHNRQKIVEAQMKIDAWTYIQKHIESFWD